MWIRCVYIYTFIAFIFNSLYSQEYLAPVSLSIEDGLSSRQVNSLTFDTRGFLWIGTKYGLNRYDGYGFLHFFKSSSESGYPGIQNNKKVKIDFQGNIWTLNEAGINRMDARNGDIMKFPSSAFDAVFHDKSALLDFCITPDGTVWVLSDQSLTMITTDQIITTYLITPEILSDNLPTSIAADQNGNIWIGTSSGLITFNIHQKNFKELAGRNTAGLLSDNYVNCLFFDEEKALWIGTRNGINRVDPIDFAFYEYYPGRQYNNVMDITKGQNNDIILATTSGIVKMDRSSHDFDPVYSDDNTEILSVDVDSSGNIWAGSSRGILMIGKSKLNLRNYFPQDENYHLPFDKLSALLPLNDNQLLLGFENSMFGVFDIKTAAFNSFKTFDESSVVSFYPYRQNEYFVVTRHNIEIFSTARKISENLSDKYKFIQDQRLEDTQINCLCYDGEKTVWLGTSDGLQVIRFDSARHRILKTLRFNDQEIETGEIYDLEIDPSGKLWMGTDNGLLFYNPLKGNYSRYTPYDVNLLNTERKAVYTIIQEKPGIFCLGTSGGIYRFETRNHEFAGITENAEIVNASIRVLSCDRKGNLWISSESGLYQYIKNNGIIKSYDIKDGLINNTYSTIYQGNNNQVYLGGNEGLTVITATDNLKESYVPDIAITGIRYIENDESGSDLYFQVPDTIVLPWRRRPLQISFAVLELTHPEKNQYKYSFDKTKKPVLWKSIGSQNKIVLNYLSPGKYRLLVSGSNSGLMWSNKTTSVVIIIEAPYWRSSFGIAAIILTGLFLVFIFFRFWIRQFFNLSRENQEREMFAKQIMLQKEELTLKNKAITDSINYAKRIQTAMLPPYKLFKSIFPSSFILFMPKDIVSGDFYWVNKFGNKIFVSAVDCTGHGVPGAFMSIIGFELFRKITNIEGLSRPSDILNRLNDDFHEIFKDVDNVVLRDGMDVAFCSIDKKDMILEFAGAFNPLYLIRDNKIMEVKGDRFAIGLDETNFRDQTFKNHIIPIQKGDIIYIFSDGFSDQFGGPDGKKYKYRRFRHLLLNLHQLPMEKQHEILENNVMEWRGEQEQVDDILVIGIKIDF